MEIRFLENEELSIEISRYAPEAVQEELSRTGRIIEQYGFARKLDTALEYHINREHIIRRHLDSLRKGI